MQASKQLELERLALKPSPHWHGGLLAGWRSLCTVGSSLYQPHNVLWRGNPGILEQAMDGAWLHGGVVDVVVRASRQAEWPQAASHLPDVLESEFWGWMDGCCEMRWTAKWKKECGWVGGCARLSRGYRARTI